MTDWDGTRYRQVSDLQQWLADRALHGLALDGVHRVLDVGCGDGRITARVAARLDAGEVLGIDPSPRMVEVAAALEPTGPTTLRFEIGDVVTMACEREFDLVVSFNALHWVADQRDALVRISAALRPGGRALLVMVCAGPRPSLEQAAMDVTATDRWRRYFADFPAPFRHVDPAAYGALADEVGLATTALDVEELSWDFGSTEAFTRWCRVGFGAWTTRVPDRADAFVDDVVAAYARATSGPARTFRFMQMRASFVASDRRRPGDDIS